MSSNHSMNHAHTASEWWETAGPIERDKFLNFCFEIIEEKAVQETSPEEAGALRCIAHVLDEMAAFAEDGSLTSGMLQTILKAENLDMDEFWDGYQMERENME